MKITKFVHSCLLIEMPEPINRTALFDPGMMSAGALVVDKLEYLDDIIITHLHGDHFAPDLVAELVKKFPKVRITAPAEVVKHLSALGISSSDLPSDGIEIFTAPHEDVSPLFPDSQNIGVHYLNLLTDPGDSHTFQETKPVLVLPVTAPWGDVVRAAQLGLRLKPKYIIPVHDWHWSDDARTSTYDQLEGVFAKENIQFMKPETGVAFVLDV
jgi:L-ascorbate metabolism protein UlaG (beta-lactamase superfamily)